MLFLALLLIKLVAETTDNCNRWGNLVLNNCTYGQSCENCGAGENMNTSEYKISAGFFCVQANDTNYQVELRLFGASDRCEGTIEDT